ncbi:unnamed protein product, partial [Meganyctiphanes norvegica]
MELIKTKLNNGIQKYGDSYKELIVEINSQLLDPKEIVIVTESITVTESIAVTESVPVTESVVVTEIVSMPETGGTPSFCKFPFIFKRVTYTACTTKDDPAGRPWCSIKTDTKGNHIGNANMWRHCDDEKEEELLRSLTLEAPSFCKFPFIFKRVTYTACTTKDDPAGRSWCSIKTDTKGNHIGNANMWRHCDDEEEEELLEAPSFCKFPFIFKRVTYTACTTKDDPAGRPWCSIKTDTKGNHIGNANMWRHCD